MRAAASPPAHYAPRAAAPASRPAAATSPFPRHPAASFSFLGVDGIRGAALRSRRVSAPASASTPAPLAAAGAPSNLEGLPPSNLEGLPPSVAVLEAPNPSAPGGITRVYVLGISHISGYSVDQVRDVIRRVRPEVVMVELCKDRDPLLVPELCRGRDSVRLSRGGAAGEEMKYYSEATSLIGAPPGAPGPEELGLRCHPPGRALDKADMEADAAALAAAGYSSASPSTVPPRRGQAVMFAIEGAGEGQPCVAKTVMPLSSIDYIVEGLGGAAAPPPPQPEGPAGELPPLRGVTEWRAWTPAERGAVASGGAGSFSNGGGKDSMASTFGKQYLLRPYAEQQARAGVKVGVGLGAAWQVALQEAAACGAAQVILGDRLSSASARRLSDAVWAASAVPLVGPAAGAGLALLAAAASDGGAAAGALVAAAAAMAGASALTFLRLQEPIKALGALADSSAGEIEAALKRGLDAGVQGPGVVGRVDLEGEDALLSWPGAEEAVLGERDLYMAATLHAAATGARALSPAYVAVEGGAGMGRTMQYMMPQGGPAGAVTPGAGAGEYAPLAGVSAVVGVVGITHVDGIVKAWPEAARIKVEELL